MTKVRDAMSDVLDRLSIADMVGVGAAGNARIAATPAAAGRQALRGSRKARSPAGTR
jgi:GTP cyclohydrolase III